MLFAADEYSMTADEKQRIKNLGKFHCEFQFLEVHRICLKHHMTTTLKMMMIIQLRVLLIFTNALDSLKDFFIN